jgi:hypothetical protein
MAMKHHAVVVIDDLPFLLRTMSQITTANRSMDMPDGVGQWWVISLRQVSNGLIRETSLRLC